MRAILVQPALARGALTELKNWLAISSTREDAALLGLLVGIPSLRLKGDYLAIECSVDSRESYECEVGGVEHEFDAHEYNDRISANNNAYRANGEEKC